MQLATVAGFAVIGFAALSLSHAETFASASEAEGGNVSGNYSPGDPSGASGGAAVAFGGQVPQTPPQPGSGFNVLVNFGAPIGLSQRDPMSLGGTVSGYGTAWTADASGQCTNQPCATMKRLGLGGYRVSIQWNNGNPVSGAGGNGTGGPAGDQLIDTIRAAGAEPIIVIGGKGGQNDMDFTASDAAGLVQHYTSGKYAGAAAVKYWVVGNEPSNGGNGNMSIGSYCTFFNTAASAMKQANSGIKLVGPAWPYYDLNTLKQFLQCAGNNLDVLDYHAYGQSSQDIDTNIQGSAAVYEQQGKDVRAAINSLVPARASQIVQQVGEYNVSPFATSDTSDARFYTAGNTIWNAIATGSILKGGSRAYLFADQNNPLGMIFQSQSIASLYGRSQFDPQPAYHGMGMFSGEGGLFRPFGSSLVQSISTNPDIVVYAAANSNSIVLINKNKSATQTANVQLQGLAAGSSATIWQTDASKPFDPPANKGSQAVSSSLSYSLPPYSVTSVILQ